MDGMISAIQGYYTFYTMLLVVGSGLFIYFHEYKNMLKKNAQKEAKISKYIGLTYTWGGIALYVLTIFLG